MKNKKKIFSAIGIAFAIILFSIFLFNSNSSPKVSIVLPTYNRASFLPGAISSVLNQTYQDFELIIIDDGSSDNTPMLLNNYRKNKKIKIITHSQNKGVSEARNSGYKYATGKYIALLDSDDFFKPDYLEKVVLFMEEHPTLTIGIPVKNAYDDKMNEYPWHYPAYDFFNGNHLGNVGNIFKRDFIVKHNIRYNTDYTCGEDYDFWVQMLLKGASIGKIKTKHALIAFRPNRGLSVSGNCHYTSNIVRNMIFDRIKYPKDGDRTDMCLSLKYAIKTFPNIFLESEKEEIKKICPASTDIFIKAQHPSWSDYLIFDDASKVYKLSNKDIASILLFIPHEKITIKWEKWGTETFIYDKDKNTYILK